MAIAPRCAAHLREPAGWVCDDCGRRLCRSCAVKRVFGERGGSVVACIHCGAHAQVLRLARPMPAFGALLQDALRYPFSDGGRVFLVTAAVVSVFHLMGAPGRMFSGVLVIGWLFRCADETGRGRREIPGMHDAEDFFSLARAAQHATLPFFIGAGPWLVWSGLRNALGFGPSHAADPIGWLAIAVGALWTPLALVLVVVGSSYASVMNPAHIWRAGRTFSGDLTRIAVPFWACVAAFLGLGLAADAVTDATNIFVLPHLVIAPARLYLALVGARVLGTLLYARGGELGYGRIEDWTDPALGTLEPLETRQIVESTEAVAPAPVEPIELPELPKPVFHRASAAPEIAQTPAHEPADDLMPEEEFMRLVDAGTKREE